MSIYRFLILFFVFFLYQLRAKAQIPLNDNCNFARVIIIPDDGDTCITGSNLNANSDGIYNVCDSVTLNLLPPGGHEVWFTYISTGLNNSITVTPSGATPAQFVSVTIPTLNCSSLTYNTCNSASSGIGSASVNWSFAAGTQVWFSVTALSVDGEFTVCVSSTTPPVIPGPGVGTDCSNAIPICDKHTFVSPGPVFNNATGPISCYAFGPQNVLWYKFTAGTNDSLIWLATPNAGYELDWSINDITAGCPGIPVACNFATAAGGGAPTGMVSGSISPCGPISQICTPIVLTAGNTYAMHFNIENFLNAGIDTPSIKIEFGGIFKMAPYADFQLSNSSGCDSLTTTFVNNSISATNYQWDFGNGNTSLLANPPPQTYSVPGTYVVSLVASNPLSCASVNAKAITVFPKPVSSFTVTDTIICLGTNDTISTSQPSNPNYAYTWSFSGANIISGSGSGPYIINWNTAGMKTIDLSVLDNSTMCLSNLFSKTINVISVPDSSFSMASSACEGDTILINYSGTPNLGNIYNWNFGTANVISGSGPGPYALTYPSSGVFDVSLLVNLNGCKSDDTNTVTVSTSPVSNAGADVVLCSGEQQQIGSPAIVGYSFSWAPSIGLSASNIADPVFSFVNNSLFSDTLYFILTTSTGSCNDDDSVRIIVKKNITSDFSISDDSLCAGEPAAIIYLGNALSSSVYNWDFNNGNAINSGGQNYNITWSAGQTDTVSMFVVENGCNSDTTVRSVTIFYVPDAFAGPDIELCSGETDTLGSLATVGVNYSWIPSAGLNNSTLSNPLVTGTSSFNQNDTIQYIMIANADICQSTDTVSVIVKPVQNILITGPNSICINNSLVQFLNASQQVTGYTFSWSFGANATPAFSNSFNPPPVSFSSTGTQWIYYSALGNSCPSKNDSLEIIIYPVPNPGFLLSNSAGCPPLTVSFIDTTNAQVGSLFFWDFGNGDTSTQQNPQIVYNQSGLYDVTLTVTTPDTCSASYSMSSAVSVYNLPDPDFIATPPVANILNPQVVFTNQSINTDFCLYNFGDGFSSVLCDDIHVYTDTGTYLVQLIATSSQGCVDTAEHYVRIESFEAFYVPTAFTPNNDGVNDIFIFSGSPVRDFQLEVFNRWGQLTFLSNDINKGWNGTDIKSGQAAIEGVYAYKILYTDFGNVKHEKKGVISLIR